MYDRLWRKKVCIRWSMNTPMWSVRYSSVKYAHDRMYSFLIDSVNGMYNNPWVIGMIMNMIWYDMNEWIGQNGCIMRIIIDIIVHHTRGTSVRLKSVGVIIIWWTHSRIVNHARSHFVMDAYHQRVWLKWQHISSYGVPMCMHRNVSFLSSHVLYEPQHSLPPSSLCSTNTTHRHTMACHLSFYSTYMPFVYYLWLISCPVTTPHHVAAIMHQSINLSSCTYLFIYVKSCHIIASLAHFISIKSWCIYLCMYFPFYLCHVIPPCIKSTHGHVSV